MKTINGLGHVALKVKDVDKSMAFYNGVLGFPEMLRLHHDDGSLFLVYLRITDTQYLELFPNAANDRAPGLDANGVHHFCLTVERLEPVLDALLANGGTPYVWTKTKAGMALEPVGKPVISNGLDGNRQSWLEDPDGNRIELMEMAPDCLQYRAIRRLQSELV
jgi:lactoylglutathione lyase